MGETSPAFDNIAKPSDRKHYGLMNVPFCSVATGVVLKGIEEVGRHSIILLCRM
jgi:hypothetical protein